MKINKKAWHYRWLNRLGVYPSTLCTYFWTVVFTVALTPIVVPVLAVILIVIGIPVLSVIYLRDKWQEKHRGQEPSIFWQYLAAKKRKVCPLIEYDWE